LVNRIIKAQSIIAFIKHNGGEAMKTLNKKIFAFLMAICMIVPMCAQPVSAASSSPNSSGLDDLVPVPKSWIGSTVITSSENLDPNNLDDDGISPLLDPTTRDMGVGIRKIRVYPMLVEIQSKEPLYLKNIYRQANYVNYSQFQGLQLSKSETQALMMEVWNEVVAAGAENAYGFAGWVLYGEVEYHYKNPKYVNYQLTGSGIDAATSPFKKVSLSPYETLGFSTAYYYPENVDLLNEYYYVGVSGGCYHVTSSGVERGTAFNYSASFNH